MSRPKNILYNRINDIKNTISNLATFKNQYIKNKQGVLGHYASLIKMMGPENILKKGYAIVRVGRDITSDPNQIKVGANIDIILKDTLIETTVKHKHKYNGRELNL